jgi:hypothetical protein
MEKSPFRKKVRSWGEFMVKGSTATVFGAAWTAGEKIPSRKKAMTSNRIFKTTLLTVLDKIGYYILTIIVKQPF